MSGSSVPPRTKLSQAEALDDLWNLLIEEQRPLLQPGEMTINMYAAKIGKTRARAGEILTKMHDSRHARGSHARSGGTR